MSQQKKQNKTNRGVQRLPGVAIYGQLSTLSTIGGEEQEQEPEEDTEE